MLPEYINKIHDLDLSEALGSFVVGKDVAKAFARDWFESFHAFKFQLRRIGPMAALNTPTSNKKCAFQIGGKFVPFVSIIGS